MSGLFYLQLFNVDLSTFYTASVERVTSSGAPKESHSFKQPDFHVCFAVTHERRVFYLMATIFKRIKHLKVSPTQEVKMQIGKEVCTVYFSQPRRAKIFKIKSIEPEGEFMALSYPKSFNDTIDKIILRFCPPERKKRPRTNRVGGAKP